MTNTDVIKLTKLEFLAIQAILLRLRELEKLQAELNTDAADIRSALEETYNLPKGSIDVDYEVNVETRTINRKGRSESEDRSN